MKIDDRSKKLPPSPPAAPKATQSTVSAPAASTAKNTLAPAAPRDAFTRQTARNASTVSGAPQLTTPGQAPLTPRFTPLDPSSSAVTAAAQATKTAMPQQVPAVGTQDTFTVKSAAQDEFGTTHVRMDRSHNGVPVFGEQAIGHVANDGGTTVTGLMGQIPADLGKGQPAMSAQKAADTLAARFGLKPGAIGANEMTRVIAQGTDGKYRDTWMVSNFFSGATQMNAQIGADDGKITSWSNDNGIVDPGAMKYAEQQAASPSQPEPKRESLFTPSSSPDAVLGNDHSEFSGMVEIGGTPVGTTGKQQMLDTTRGSGIETRDNQGQLKDATPVTMTDNNGAWAESTDPKGQKNAVDAQYGAQMTYDFYKNVLGRDSIDGKGQKLDSVVNTRLVDGNGNLAPNAFWDGSKMTYGIGDGRTFGDLTAMDVTGHEISHGVTEATAGLIYRNESGGINESLSDILGTGVEWYASQHNPNIQSNFEIGEDAFTPGRAGDALRYMDNPTRDGRSLDHYSQMARIPKDSGVGPNSNDNGGVHTSSGIMNNAFYLMSQRGQNHTSGLGVDKPMGIEDSLKIFSRAQQYYMTPNTTFAFARESTLRAAADLYGKDSAQVAAVKQAWSAVGVEGTASVS